MTTPLHDPSRERDACGIGLVADAHGRASRELVDRALAGLAAVAHRGAWAADGVSGVHPSRSNVLKITELDVVNADRDPELYLSNFMASRAWVADGSNWKPFESDEEDNAGADVDAADEWEHAYNM